MAAYDSLPADPPADDDASEAKVAAGASSSAAGPLGPADKFVLSRLGDRVELREEDSEGGRACETWRFDEDAYTLGLTALFSLYMPNALPSLLLSFAAPALQVFISMQVFGYLTTVSGSGEGNLGVRLVCSFLSIIQLTNEAVEGLYKVIFSLRWLLGFYDCRLCKPSAIAGATLGFVQMVNGVVTCVLCINVIFGATTVLDTFFNYVALAFIADVDNYIINSRIIRSYHTFDPEIKVRWKPADQLKAANSMWLRLVVIACNVVLMLMVPFTVMGNEVRNSKQKEPLELGWWSMVPRCLVIWLALHGAVWLAGRRFPICRVASGITILTFLMLVVTFALSETWKGESPGKGCRTWSPLERVVLWTFSTMLLPCSCAAEIRPFSVVKLIPFQVNLVIISTLIWNYELIHNGCA